MKKYISIDIGGTAIKYGIVSENAEVLLKKEMKTEAQKGGPAILEKVIGIVEELKGEADAGPRRTAHLPISLSWSQALSSYLLFCHPADGSKCLSTALFLQVPMYWTQLQEVVCLRIYLYRICCKFPHF